MNAGKPFCEIDRCMENAEDCYNFCLQHNPKYEEGRFDLKQEIIRLIKGMEKEDRSNEHGLDDEHINYNKALKDILNNLSDKK